MNFQEKGYEITRNDGTITASRNVTSNISIFKMDVLKKKRLF
jgi:hypothetical protein